MYYYFIKTEYTLQISIHVLHVCIIVNAQCLNKDTLLMHCTE